MPEQPKTEYFYCTRSLEHGGCLFFGIAKQLRHDERLIPRCPGCGATVRSTSKDRNE